MKIPKGMTEQEVLDIIDNVANRLWYKFKFGYHERDDMLQQCRLHALQLLEDEKYDNKRPLENFLYVCVHNKLFNDKRDGYERPDKPCLNCPFDAYIKHIDGCSEFLDKHDCDLYSSWYKRNFIKRNIMQPMGIDNINDEHEDNMKIDNFLDSIIHKEIVDLIDSNMPIVMRHDWIRARRGIKLSKGQYIKLKDKIIQILETHNINVTE